MQFRPERLREAREQKGITQRELAQRCGINEFQLSRYETGKTEPSLVNLALIARFLDISSDYLIDLTDNKQKRFGDTDIKDEERAILETFRRDGWQGDDGTRAGSSPAIRGAGSAKHVKFETLRNWDIISICSSWLCDYAMGNVGSRPHRVY